MRHEVSAEIAFCWGSHGHGAADVGRLVALRTLHQVKLDGFALIQRTIAIFLDRGKVHEYVFSSGPLDKAVAFRSVKPLDCSLLSHSELLFVVTTMTLSGAALGEPSLRQRVLSDWPFAACPWHKGMGSRVLRPALTALAAQSSGALFPAVLQTAWHETHPTQIQPTMTGEHLSSLLSTG